MDGSDTEPKPSDAAPKPGDGKDIWDKIRASGTALVALAVGVLGYWINNLQSELDRQSSETQFFTQLMAERERSDSDLRAQMFTTLFEAYFKDKLHVGDIAIQTASRDPDATIVADTTYIDIAHQQVMFLDVLARNFETIDLRPLFEEIDDRLTRRVWPDTSRLREAPRDARAAPNAIQRSAFRERETLRRAARNVVARQAASLASLPKAKTQRLRVRQESCDTPRNLETTVLSGGVDVWLEPRGLEDGKVIAMVAPGWQHGEETDPQSFPEIDVTFFDMPAIENMILPSGERLAVVLEKYVSPVDYAGYLDLLGTSLQFDYRYYLENPSETPCREAFLTLVQFPPGYLGLRDRPYIEQLITRTFGKKDDATEGGDGK